MTTDWHPTRRELLTGATGLVVGGAAVTAGQPETTANANSTDVTTVQACKTTTEDNAEAETDRPIMRLDEEVEVVRHNLDHAGLWPGLTVAVKNTSDEPLEWVRVHARLYDSDDIRIASGTERKEGIPAGVGREFTILFTGAGSNEGATYRMWVATP